MVDGDIIFNLSGTYDPVARDYSVSASSSMIRYTINGAFNSSGVSLGSTATLAIKDPITKEFDQSVTYVVEITNAEVDVTEKIAYEDSDEYKGLPPEEQEALDNGGAPAWGRGWWTFYQDWGDGYTYTGKAIATQWSFLMEGDVNFPDGNRQKEKYNYTIVELKGAGSNYEVIVSYPQYKGEESQVDDAVQAFLAENNLSATRWKIPINWETGQGFPQETGIYYFIEDMIDEYVVSLLISNMPSFDWRTFDKWYSTNYLENYLVKQNVTPTTRYEKHRLVFNGNKSTMTTTTLMDDSQETSWSNISDARAATTPRPDSSNVFKR